MHIATDPEFNRASIAANDFEKAIEFATAARDYPANSVVYEALLIAAILCYVRPFSSNEKSNDSPAASRLGSTPVDLLSGPERRQHDNYCSLRNKAIAHSEFTMNPTRFDPATGLCKSRPFSILTPPFDLEAFIDIVGKVSESCQRDRAEYVLRHRR